MGVNSVNKTNYKLFLIYFKIYPTITAVCYVVYSLLSCFINVDFIGYIAHCSVLSIILLLICSKLFEYCIYHRIPIYYIIINEIVNISLFYINIDIKDIYVFIINLILAIIYIYLYIKFKRKSKTN